MEERATGFVLRTYPLTETSLIVHWLTAEAGRIATVAKGARRPKSAFRGLLDLFYHCDFSFTRSRRSELHNLREVRLRDPHEALRTELGWLRQAAYGATLIVQATESDTPLPEMFELFRQLLEALPRHPPEALTLFTFELVLLQELGLMPDLATARLSPGSRRILEQCLAEGLAREVCLKLAPEQTAEMRQYLQGFLLHHLGRIPPGRTAALDGLI
jgi:DNA repair protein RecO (recombination protein O)